MNTQQIEKLKQIGNHWAKGEAERIYFNNVKELVGFDLLDEFKVTSKKKARDRDFRLSGSKFYLDIKAMSWGANGLNGEEFQCAIASVKAELAKTEEAEAEEAEAEEVTTHVFDTYEGVWVPVTGYLTCFETLDKPILTD